MFVRPKIFVTGDGYSENHFELLKLSGFDVIWRSGTPSRARLADELPCIHSYILGGEEKLGRAEFDVARQLKRISFVGKGVGAFVDLGLAEERGIEVKYTPDVMVNAVVEHTNGVI